MAEISARLWGVEQLNIEFSCSCIGGLLVAEISVSFMGFRWLNFS